MSNEQIKARVIFLVDNISHKGGAHFATLNKVRLLHENGFEITIFSGHTPSAEVLSGFPFVSFITPKELKNNDTQEMLELINSFDIVCTPNEDSVFRKAASLSKAYKIQWIHTNYAEWKDTTPYSRKVTADDKELYAKFEKIVFVSKASLGGFVQLYPELTDKTDVCYNLLDTDKIKTMAGTELSGDIIDRDMFNIITVTRMSNSAKLLTRTLEIIERLKAEGYRFKWLFAGDGVDFEPLQRYSRALDLGSHVTWLGHLDNPYCIVKNADLFALLSRYEGYPLVIYESLIIGTPVISTYYNTDEAYTPADMGFYVENSADAIYSGLKNLLDNKDLIAAAKSRLGGYTYDAAECGEQILKVFREGAG